MKYDIILTRRNFIPLLTAPLIGAALFFLYICIIERLPSGSGDCVFHLATHMYCPGCGGTRAVKLLLTGHPLLSLRAHPAVLFTAAPLLYYYMKCWIRFLQNRRAVLQGNGVRITIRLYFLFVTLAVILLFFILRNILLVSFDIDLLKGLAI